MTTSGTMKGVEASTYDDQSDMNTSMDEGSQCSESITLCSPPRSARRFTATRPAGGGFGSAASRLFTEDEGDDSFSKRSSILKPIDLNMELSGATNDGSVGVHGARTPFRNLTLDNPLRKRHAEQQGIARDLIFDDLDDEDGPQVSPGDMIMMSPHISPSCYRSPSAYRPAALNKSPCYRTMDGRTVQSKNPFSPMYTDESAVTPLSNASLSDSLNFPVSLESGSLSGPLLRHRLQKRETNLNPSAFPSFAASNYEHYENITRDGYPERKGRYSFTGSPIREMDFEHSREPDHSIPHKVRRLSKLEDAPGAESSHSEEYSPIKTKPPRLDMDEVLNGDRHKNYPYYRWNDDVSPTDVMSFPSPPGTPVPPTPSKPRHYRGRPKTRYTPVRKPAVPQTPVPERRPRSNFCSQSTDEQDVNLTQSQSRFHSDFDVIGELGNGSFGNVFKVLSRLDGCMYAIKVAHRPAKGHSDKDRMLKEVSMCNLNHLPSSLSFLTQYLFCVS